MPLSWTRQPIRFFQHLLREADADTLSETKLVAETLSVGAGGCIVMGGGFSAWYPTRLDSQTINPLMTGDFLGEMLAAAKAEGLRVIVRMDISKGRSGLEIRHPDWCVRAADGAIRTIWDMPQMCPTGPFWQREVFAILDEILTRYPALDGFFFNYLHVAPCHCSRCQAAVQASTGAPVPESGQRSPAYENWRQGFLADYMARVRAHIHARHPGAAVIPYHHVHDGWDIRRMAGVSDIISSQVSNPVIPNPLDPQPDWAHWATEQAMLAQALKPGSAPILIQTTSEVFASRQSAMPDARLITNLVQAAAQGANTAPAVNGLLDQPDARFVPALRAFAAYQRDTAPWYCGLSNPARIAIVRSEESRLWGPDAGQQAGQAGGHIHELRGMVEAISDLRHPFALLVAGALSVDALARFEVVILPGAHCLSDADAAVLTQYVADGGTLICTADSGAMQPDGMPRLSAASPVLAPPVAAQDVTGGYFALRDPVLRFAFRGIPHLPATGRFWPQPDAMGDLRLLGPFTNNAPEFTVVSGDGTAPALIRRSHGAGQAIWMTFSPGAVYHQFALPEYRMLIGHLLNDLLGGAPIRSTAPLAVEMTLTNHPQGQVLHLINRAAPAGKGQVDIAPLAGFCVAVQGQATEVLHLNTGRMIPARAETGWCHFHVDRLDDFAAFALTGPSPV